MGCVIIRRGLSTPCFLHPVDLVEGQVVDEVGKKYTCTSSDTYTKHKIG